MLRRRVLETIREHAMFEGARRILVACSGGPDSQCLLHVLAALRDELGVELCAASVDHGLRPDAARDVETARSLATALEIPFHALQVQVQALPSRQAWARKARYHALLACAAERGADRVAVGHTLDDQAETVLSRLLRGTGIEGLSAIQPVREDGVVRPLLGVRRAEVEAYIAEHSLPFATDPSNEDERFLRVRVRRELLPRLAEVNPQLAPQLAALAEDAREVRSLIAREAARALREAGAQVTALKEETPTVRRWALKIRVERELGIALQRNHLVALDRMLSFGGQVRLPGDFVAELGTHGELVLSRVSKRGRGVRRPTQGTEFE